MIIDNKTLNCFLSVSITDKWFRMPNQTKKQQKGSEHIIIHGKMEDFIVDYIPENSMNIDDKFYIETKINKNIILQESIVNDDLLNTMYDDVININNENNENIIGDKKIELSDIKEIISNLNVGRADNYDNWISVGMALKKILNDDKILNVWIEWSKNSDKFKDGECEKKWKSFSIKDKSYNIGTLLKMLKEDNIEKFNLLCKKFKKLVENLKN